MKQIWNKLRQLSWKSPVCTIGLGISVATAGTSAWTTLAFGQQSISVEERFQDVFLTAGYCTAFGAAMGTALLAWTTNPTENLKYVAIGASLGFIGGSILGTYVVLSPLATTSPDDPYKPTLALSPVLDLNSNNLVGMNGTYTFFKF